MQLCIEIGGWPEEKDYDNGHPLARNERALRIAEQAQIYLEEENRYQGESLIRAAHSIVCGELNESEVRALSPEERDIWCRARLKTLFILSICYGYLGNNAERARLLDKVEQKAGELGHAAIVKYVEAERDVVRSPFN